MPLSSCGNRSTIVPSTDNFASGFSLTVLVAMAARVMPPHNLATTLVICTMMRLAKACSGHPIPVDKPVRYHIHMCHATTVRFSLSRPAGGRPRRATDASGA
jgi:hypothetical protein